MTLSMDGTRQLGILFLRKDRKKTDVQACILPRTAGLLVCLDVRTRGSNGGRANGSVLKGDGTKSPDAGEGISAHFLFQSEQKKEKDCYREKDSRMLRGSIEAAV